MQNYYFSLYLFYNNLPILLLRFAAAVGLLMLIVLTSNVFIHGIAIVLLMLFFMNEIFIHFKINRMLPSDTVESVRGDSEDVLFFRARVTYTLNSQAYEIASKFENLYEVQFFKHKIGAVAPLPKIEMARRDLLDKAVVLVKQARGKYVTGVDLYAAYILSVEMISKNLENNDLDEDDLVQILMWARHKFSVDLIPAMRPEFKGLGYGEFLVYGWHYEIKKYGKDLTEDVISRKFEPILIGRETEYERLVTTLCKKGSNNVLFVGEPGTGATTLVEHFTYIAHMGEVPPGVARKKVYQMQVDRILSGITNQGEMAERLDLLLEDISHAGNVIVFIPNIENIFGGGGFSFDVSGVLYEYIKNGSVSIIGTTTPSGFKKYVEREQAVMTSFEVIRLEEPDLKTSLHMILANIDRIERLYNTEFVYKAILSSVELSSSYLLDSYLPGKAVALLESVASEVTVKHKRLISEADILRKIEEKTNIVLGHPDEKERQMLLGLEDIIHKRVVDQEEAVFAVANALRRLRSGFKTSNRPISVFLFLGPTGVGKTETAKVLASLYFRSDKEMIRLDMSEFQTPESVKRLLGSLPGEDQVTSKFIEDLAAHPFSLVLLDEFEKAHPRILDIFLQVFDDGRLTDNQGRRVSFSNTIIIATSNAGSELIRERVKAGKRITDIKDELFEYLQRERVFKPELLNRFDDVVLFKPLSASDIENITRILLNISLGQLQEQHITISFDEQVVKKVSSEAFDAEFGARPVRRYLELNVESMLSTMLLKSQLRKGDNKKLTVDPRNNFVLV